MAQGFSLCLGVVADPILRNQAGCSAADAGSGAVLPWGHGDVRGWHC